MRSHLQRGSLAQWPGHFGVGLQAAEVEEIAISALGFCKRKHQDWFDQNDQDILTLIEVKRSAHAAWLSDENSASKHAHFKQLRGQVQSRTRELKNAWWGDKATEVQNHADNKL